jgi:hypothetical protein
MSFGSASTESLFARLLRTENISAITVSTLAEKFGIRGASETTLSKVLKGKSLDPDTSIKLRSLLLMIDAIRNSVLPLKLNWQNAEEIKTWIEAFEKGKLRVSVEFDRAPEDQHFIIYQSGGALTGFDWRNRPVIGTEDQALVFSAKKVDQILNFLIASDLQGATARPTNRDVNTSDNPTVLF